MSGRPEGEQTRLNGKLTQKLSEKGFDDRTLGAWSIIMATFPPGASVSGPPNPTGSPIKLPIGSGGPVGVVQVLLEALLPPKCIEAPPLPTPKGLPEQWIGGPGLGAPDNLERKNLGVTRPLPEVVAASGNSPLGGWLLPLPLPLLLLPFSKDVVDESGLGHIGEGDGVWHTGDEPLEWK
uniref:Uncharacterized protein n=1 Tax=Anopheles atroparvus TaxID=41427 RepID=A0A182ISE4_ANOAO